jgi:hypothetical protein
VERSLTLLVFSVLVFLHREGYRDVDNFRVAVVVVLLLQCCKAKGFLSMQRDEGRGTKTCIGFGC